MKFGHGISCFVFIFLANKVVAPNFFSSQSDLLIKYGINLSIVYGCIGRFSNAIVSNIMLGLQYCGFAALVVH